MKRLISLTAALSLFVPALLAPVPATAQDAPDTPAGGAWTECSLLAISAYRGRIGITCTPDADKTAPSQFAVEMTNPLADATLRLAQQSLTLKRPLRVLYVIAPEGNPAGCDPKNCRGIVGIEAR